jgi:HEAT repeat protein
MSEIDLTAIISDFTSGSDSRADSAARELASLGTQNLNPFKQLLSHPHVDVRWWSVRSLAEVQSPAAATLLIDCLSDADQSVRHCAALALHQQPDSSAVPALIQALKSSDQLLARIAGDALIAVGSEAVPALLEVLQHDSPPARIAAARALALIGDTRAIPELFKVLDEESALLEHWAGEGLERMGVGMVFYQP